MVVQREMERYGIKVVRFLNSEVEKNIEGVVKEIENEIKNIMESPPWGFRDRSTEIEEW